MSVVLQDRRTVDRRRTDVVGRRAAIVAIACLSVLDVVTTSWLRSKGGVEMNPVAGWLIANGLLVVAKLVAVGAVAVLLHRARARPWITPVVWFVAGIYAAVISLHLLQLAAA